MFIALYQYTLKISLADGTPVISAAYSAVCGCFAIVSYWYLPSLNY